MAMFNSYVSLPEGMGYTKAYNKEIRRPDGLPFECWENDYRLRHILK